MAVAAAIWFVSAAYYPSRSLEYSEPVDTGPEDYTDIALYKPLAEPPQEQEVIESYSEPTPEPAGPVFTIKDGIGYLEFGDVDILVVNKVYPIPSDYGGPNEEALMAVNEMIRAAADDGIALFIVSGYRSYDTQEAIYNRYVSQWGQEYTDRVSARPGHSEHQTGLAYDLNSLERAFADTKEYEWLQLNCAEYGFILRYLEDSEWATGYSYEPWHYRYIGDKVLAREIMESGVSLEEFSGLITQEGQSGYPE